MGLAVLAAVALATVVAYGRISTARNYDPSWRWEHPLPQGNQLNGMSFVATDTGWAVGRSGVVLKTTDGGNAWQFQDAGVYRDWSAVSFASTSTGWVVGDRGTIKRTGDGGSTWTTQTAAVSSTLRGVASVGVAQAIAVGDASGGSATIRFTTNGGTAWSSGTTTVTASLFSVAFPSPTLAWAVGANGTMVRSADGGQSWVATAALTSQSLNAVTFAPGTAIGYAVGNPNGTTWTAFKTTNGSTWTPLTLTGAPVSLQSVSCDPSGTQVTATGVNGTVFRSADGGTTWTAQNPPRMTQVTLRASAMPGTGRVNVAGDFGTLLYSRDSGARWMSETQRASATINDCWFNSATAGWAVGTNGLLMRTTDGGASWSGKNVGTSTALSGVSFPSTTVGYVVGPSGLIMKTSDAGASWTVQASGLTTQAINDVWFTSTNSGWAVGDAGTILTTTNGGSTWTKQTSGTTANLNDVAFSGSTGWTVGARGTVLYSANGNTWVAQTSGTNVTLNGVTVSDTKHAMAVGNAGTAIKTADTGVTWSNMGAAVGTTENLMTVSAADNNRAMVAGSRGFVAFTPNAGKKFTKQNPGLPTLSQDFPATVNGIWMADKQNAFAVAEQGEVRNTTDAGTTWMPYTYGTLSDLNAARHVSTQALWAVGAGGTVINSMDAGQTWYQQPSGAAQALRGLKMVDALHGWTVGGAGTIRYTSTGGWSWVTQTSGSAQQLNAVDANGSANAIAVGAGGAIVHTTNTGATWAAATVVPTTVSVNGVSMSSVATAWAVASSGGGATVMRTTDGGATWAAQTTTSSAGFNGVHFRPDGLHGWVVGPAGSIYRTVDGGATWTGVSSGVASDLYDVSFSSDATGWASGDRGTLLRTQDAGLTWEKLDSGTDSIALRSATMWGAHEGWVVGAAGTVMSGRDSAIPVTTLYVTPSAPDGSAGWYVTTPVIQLLPNEVASTYYSWTGVAGSYALYTGPLSAPSGASTLYFYSVDTAGNTEGVQTHAFSVDTAPPTAPGSLAVSGVGTSTASLSWAASTDAVSGLQAYLVYVNGAYYASSATPALALTDLLPNTAYTVYVVAEDVAGLVSAASNVATFTTQDFSTAPLGTSISLAPASPNGSAGWYVTTPTVTLTSLPTTVSAYTYYSYDTTASGWVTYTAPFAATPGAHTLWYYSYPQSGSRPISYLSANLRSDPVTPAAPASLTAAPTGSTSVHLSWPAVTPTYSGIDRYEIWEDGALIAAVPDGTLTYDVIGLTPSTSYSYAVRVVSVAGGVGAYSSTATTSTLSPPLPSAPDLVYARGTDGETVYVDWTYSADAIAPVTYTVWRSSDGVAYSRVATITDVYESAYVDTGRPASTQFWYAVSATDSRGESAISAAPSGIATAVTGPPSRPRGVASIAGSATVLFTWMPSTNSATAGYYVYRADRSFSTLTTLTPVPLGATATSYLDTGRTNGLKYYYRVAAVDASGNVGPASVEVMAEPKVALRPEMDPHNVGVDPDGCAACHRGHTGETNSLLTASADATPSMLVTPAVGPAARATWENQTLCLSCHNGRQGMDVATSLNATVTLSRHGLASSVTTGTMACGSCHSSHRSTTMTADPVLLNVDGAGTGNNACYGASECHGVGATVIGGDVTFFASSVHASVPTSNVAGITCVTCHEPISSPNTGLLYYNSYMVCMQCHSGAISPTTPDILSLISAGDSSSHLDLTRADQALNGTRIACQNCHNSMRVTKAQPLANPDAPFTSAWSGSVNDLCFVCHDGRFPTDAQTMPYVPSPLGSGGTSLSPDIQSAYQYNVHGYAVTTSTTNPYLRPEMGYTTGMTLGCATCHDGHGTVNAYELRQNVKSADGATMRTGRLVYKMTTGADFRFFCSACHDLTPANHLAASGVSISAFPTNCMAAGCHRHTMQPIGPAAGQPTNTWF